MDKAQSVDSFGRMDTPLDKQIQDILNGRKGQWPVIATEAGVSYSWLSKFARGYISNPGYMTLRRIQLSLRRSSAKPQPTPIEI